MKTIPNQTQSVLEAVERLGRLTQSLQSWNLVAGLHARLDSLSERLDNLGKQCRKTLQACPEEDDEVSLKAFAESMSQRGLFQDAITMVTPMGQQYFHALFMGIKAGKEAA